MTDYPVAPISYPANLPIPNAEPYNWDVGLGNISLPTNAGNTLIRRKWKHLPHIFNFSFEMTTDQMTQFVVFADTVGADWFNLDSLSMYTGSDGQVIAPQPVRFISGFSISARGFNYWDINIAAELMPDVYPFFVEKFSNNWYIGGTPSAPSNANWVLAGKPATPSANWIIAGTPGAPSGWINV